MSNDLDFGFKGLKFQHIDISLKAAIFVSSLLYFETKVVAFTKKSILFTYLYTCICPISENIYICMGKLNYFYLKEISTSSCSKSWCFHCLSHMAQFTVTWNKDNYKCRIPKKTSHMDLMTMTLILNKMCLWITDHLLVANTVQIKQTVHSPIFWHWGV